MVKPESTGRVLIYGRQKEPIVEGVTVSYCDGPMSEVVAVDTTSGFDRIHLEDGRCIPWIRHLAHLWYVVKGVEGA